MPKSLLDSDVSESNSPSKALARTEPQPDGQNIVLMFERLATNPDVDVAKLEKLIEMNERILRHNAKSAFDAGFSRMQSELPEISERGQITVKGQVRSTYARLEDIHAAIKPILKAHGFAIRHRTEFPPDKPNIIRIVGILSHEQGHSEESMFEAPKDASDYRTDIQSMGSTVSYGRRYTTLDLLNITTRGLDNDGQTKGEPKAPEAPTGYDDWFDSLCAVADEGEQPLRDAWSKSKPAYRNYITNHQPMRWAGLKQRATRAGAQ